MAIKNKSDLLELWAQTKVLIKTSLANELLVGTGRNGTFVARDYTTALAWVNEYLKAGHTVADLAEKETKRDLRSGLNPLTRFRLDHYTPMLAYRYDELKEDKQNELFEDDTWIFTEKQNGVRGWLCYDGVEFHLYGRNYSDVDCSLMDYAPNILVTPQPSQTAFIMDVEIKFEPGVDVEEDLKDLGLGTTSTLEAMTGLLGSLPEVALGIQQRFKDKYGEDLICFRAIHPILEYSVDTSIMDYTKATIGEGKRDLDSLIEFVRKVGFNIKPIDSVTGGREVKENFLNTILAAGGEGVVAHHLSAQYSCSESRDKNGYVKIKRTVGATAGLGDTIDAFITGWVPGTIGTSNENSIGSLIFSVYVGDSESKTVKEIARVSGIDDETKAMILRDDEYGQCPQETPSGVKSIDPDFWNAVAEISGQALSSVNQRLEHARIIEWRPDRWAESCVYSQEFLDSQTTNIGIKYK